MLPSETIKRRILLVQKARDACLRAFNRQPNPKTRELLQHATQAMTATQFQLEAQLSLLTHGETN